MFKLLNNNTYSILFLFFIPLIYSCSTNKSITIEDQSSKSDSSQILKNTSNNLFLKHLSMGMSADYEKAILNGSTYLRLGTAILGERKD